MVLWFFVAVLPDQGGGGVWRFSSPDACDTKRAEILALLGPEALISQCTVKIVTPPQDADTPRPPSPEDPSTK